jgi:mRNA-degrading endonuclease RelE of RelBE toxin-antitoxin system
MEKIEEKLKKLPSNLQKEVMDFISFLLEKEKKRKKKGKPNLNWIGGLKEYRDKYTSLELQKKALEWRD